MTMQLPEDPMMLLSFVNMKLRDEYDSLQALCDDFYKQDPDDEDKWVWSLDEETWLEGMGQDFYVNKVEDADNPRTPIASDVTIGIDEESTNQWFTLINYEGWSPGMRLYYQGHLIGASDGSNAISGGTNEIRQRVIGLPNGFYCQR